MRRRCLPGFCGRVCRLPSDVDGRSPPRRPPAAAQESGCRRVQGGRRPVPRWPRGPASRLQGRDCRLRNCAHPRPQGRGPGPRLSVQAFHLPSTASGSVWRFQAAGASGDCWKAAWPGPPGRLIQRSCSGAGPRPRPATGTGLGDLARREAFFVSSISVRSRDGIALQQADQGRFPDTAAAGGSRHYPSWRAASVRLPPQ